MIKIIINCLLITLYVLSMGAKSAALEDERVPVVSLQPGESAPDLLPFARYTALIDAVTTPASVVFGPAKLSSVHYDEFYFGFTDGPTMVLFQLENSGDEEASWVFNTNRRSLRTLKLVKLSTIGVEEELLDIADMEQMRDSLHRFHNLAQEFYLKPGERCYIAVIFEAEISSRIPFKIEALRDSEQSIRKRGAQTLFFSTGTITLILINSCLFVLIRRRVFLYFVVAELAMLYQAVLLQGYTFIYLWYEYGGFNAETRVIADCLMSIYSLKFAREFLQVYQRWPRLNSVIAVIIKVGWALLWLQLSQMLLGFMDARYISIFSLAINGISSIFLPVMAFLAVRGYGLMYLPLMLSWGMVGLYVCYCVLAGMNLFTGFSDFDFWLVPLGFVEAFCMTLVLALDIRRIQNQELAAKQSIAEMLKEKLLSAQQATKVNQEKVTALQEFAERGRLMLAAGHDSKNFLGSMSYFAKALSTTDSVSESRALGEKISTVTGLLKSTLSVITDSAGSSSADADIVALETINARQLLNSVLMIHDDIAREKGITIHCVGGEHGLVSDRALLIRILSNLVTNAIKYSEGGRILIAARRSAKGLRFQVWDQGVGIDDAVLSYLLTRDAGRIRLHDHIAGEGAGLDVCFDLAAKLGTVLQARSQIGKGSVFELLIPLPVLNTGPLRCGIIDGMGEWGASLDGLLCDSDIIVSHWSEQQLLESSPSLEMVMADHFDLDVLAEVEKDNEARPLKAVVTADKSSELRSRYRDVADIVLYKPLTADILVTALALRGF